MGKFLTTPNAHQAKRDSGGVRGIPEALSVGGPIWRRNFWKKVITDHQNLAHLGNKNETWTKTQKIFGRPKSGRAEKERLYVATTRTLSAQATSHRRNSEVTPVERIALTLKKKGRALRGAGMPTVGAAMSAFQPASH